MTCSVPCPHTHVQAVADAVTALNEAWESELARAQREAEEKAMELESQLVRLMTQMEDARREDSSTVRKCACKMCMCGRSRLVHEEVSVMDVDVGDLSWCGVGWGGGVGWGMLDGVVWRWMVWRWMGSPKPAPNVNPNHSEMCCPCFVLHDGR